MCIHYFNVYSWIKYFVSGFKNRDSLTETSPNSKWQEKRSNKFTNDGMGSVDKMKLGLDLHDNLKLGF